MWKSCVWSGRKGLCGSVVCVSNGRLLPEPVELRSEVLVLTVSNGQKHSKFESSVSEEAFLFLRDVLDKRVAKQQQQKLHHPQNLQQQNLQQQNLPHHGATIIERSKELTTDHFYERRLPNGLREKIRVTTRNDGEGSTGSTPRPVRKNAGASQFFVPASTERLPCHRFHGGER